MTKPTQWPVRPAKTQISLGIRPGWSKSSLSAWRIIGSLATKKAHSEDCDQTGRMPRLISDLSFRWAHSTHTHTHTYIHARTHRFSWKFLVSNKYLVQMQLTSKTIPLLWAKKKKKKKTIIIIIIKYQRICLHNSFCVFLLIAVSKATQKVNPLLIHNASLTLRHVRSWA